MAPFGNGAGSFPTGTACEHLSLDLVVSWLIIGTAQSRFIQFFFATRERHGKRVIEATISNVASKVSDINLD